MPSLARPSAVLAALVAFLAPVLVLAQAADPAAATNAGFGWVWIVAAAAIVLALFWIIFSGRRRPAPPARRS